MRDSATLSTSRTENLEGSGEGVHQALTSGYQLAFLIAAGLLVVAVAVAVLVIRSGAAGEAAALETAEAEPAFSSEAL